MQTVITVTDSSTNQIVVGATVFINGVSQGVTDNAGHFGAQVAGSTFNLAVKAAGYVNFSQNNIPVAAGFPAVLTPLGNPILVNFLLTFSPEAPADNQPFVFSNGGQNITAFYKIGGVVVPNLSPISQTVTGSVPNYNNVSATFDLSQTTSGTITLSVSSDPGRATAQQQAITTDPDTSTLLPTLTPENEVSPEFIAPNTGQGTYLTMTQARMYIGNLFIDELNSIQFALQDNKIPVFGYASRFYDALAQGKSLVQGQFTINFISEGYLYLALQNYETNLNSDIPEDPIKDQQQARLLTLTNALQNPDPAWTPDMISSAKQEIQNLAATLGPDALQAANSGINAQLKLQNNSILGLPGEDYSNAVYTDVGFDIVLQYTGAGRTITRRLEDCHLISNESIMDHSGNVILDSYGFIARRLR